MIVKFKKLYKDSIIPTFGHDDPSNAGLDLYARLPVVETLRGNQRAEVFIHPGEAVPIGIGVAWEPGPLVYEEPFDKDTARLRRFNGWKPAMLIRGRSGLTFDDIECSPGTIDAGYRGEIRVRLRNTGNQIFIVHHGDRIAQGIVTLLPEIQVEDVGAAELSASIRGDRGFGSSGR